jgi:UDP-GlcNAc3NAcA epimerase
MKTKTLAIIGTRPQLLKVSRQWADVIVNTGQHFDKDMNDVHSPKVDYNLKTTELSKMIERLLPVIEKEKPTHLVVIGDTRSTYAGAIVAVHTGIPLIHIEAGMRSYENIIEERIRHMVDHVADYLLVTNEPCADNLKREGLPDSILVGDVEFDRLWNLMPFGRQVGEREDGALLYDYLPEWKNREKTPYQLLTIHRAELTDNPKHLKAVIDALGASGVRFIWPIHPRTAKQLKAFKIKLPKNIELIKPLAHKEMVRLILHAEKVVTDSGGVQREAVWLLKPTIVLRNRTEHEWYVLSGQSVLTGYNRKSILDAVKHFIPPTKAPDQKGNAHEQITEFIRSL